MNNDELQQQLLATQEAYQRLMGASRNYLASQDKVVKAVATHDNAQRNFSDCRAESRDMAKAMIDASIADSELRAALSNPPSLEALEQHDTDLRIDTLKEAWKEWGMDDRAKRKLEDEIAVLNKAYKCHTWNAVADMIAERKAKLEKMK